MITKSYLDDLTYNIIGCAIEVHKHLGPGLLESVYEKCMIKELSLRGLSTTSQIKIPIDYKGFYMDADLRLDLLVEDVLIVEIKAVETLHPVHEARLLSYLHLLNKPKGLLLNFCCRNIFKEGQRTFVTNLFTSLPS